LTDRPGDLDLVSPDQLARVQELLDLVVVVAREHEEGQTTTAMIRPASAAMRARS
jgi:hypothetical protein